MNTAIEALYEALYNSARPDRRRTFGNVEYALIPVSVIEAVIALEEQHEVDEEIGKGVITQAVIHDPIDSAGGMLYGIKARSRQDVLDIEAVDQEGLTIRDDGKVPFLEIELPCGEVLTCSTRAAVPYESMRCDCDEMPDVDEHWFIKYDENNKDGQRGLVLQHYEE